MISYLVVPSWSIISITRGSGVSRINGFLHVRTSWVAGCHWESNVSGLMQ